jgi:O-antigen ligase
MTPQLAALLYTGIILLLFWLDRDPKSRASLAVWLPVFWLGIAGSRSVNQWLNIGAPVGDGAAEQLLEGNPVDRNIFTLVLVIGLIVVISRWKRVFPIIKLNLPILLYFSYCLFSLTWSEYPDIGFKRWTKALGDFVMILVVLSERDPLAGVKKYLSRTGFLLIPLSVLFIKYYPEIGKTYGRWDYKAYYTGVTTNKNTLGVICLFFGVASLWRLIMAYRDKRKGIRIRQMIAHTTILLMVLWLFHMASSMTSWACFTFACVLLISTNFKTVQRKSATLHVLVALVILITGSVLFLGVSPELLKSIGKDPTLTDRTAIWSLIIHMTKNPLGGAGFETFWLGPRLNTIWALYPWGPEEAHNGYIETYINLGILGLMLMALVIATGYRNAVAAYRRRDPAGSLRVVYFTVGIVYNFTEAAFFRMMAPGWILLLMSMTRIPRSAEPKKKSILREHRAPQEAPTMLLDASSSV